ncbi:jg13200 [Pararge aegeria aegeria]|uniref:Jg13200 protein n=1 Tax=Pararge aegeria aegeria TaxID=348720 RepID=A0A8S4SIJ3_9NEOP|nr:jg13200 [Pararge aegeria aegeria]
MDVGSKVLEWQRALLSAALVDPQRGRQTLSAWQVAARPKRHQTVEFGTPHKKPMSSRERLSVDMMRMRITSRRLFS